MNGKRTVPILNCGWHKLVRFALPVIASSPASQTRPAFAWSEAHGGRTRRGGLGHERAGHNWNDGTLGYWKATRTIFYPL